MQQELRGVVPVQLLVERRQLDRAGIVEQRGEHVGIEGDDAVDRPSRCSGVGVPRLLADPGKVRCHRQFVEHQTTGDTADAHAELSVIDQQLGVAGHGPSQAPRLDRAGEQDQIRARFTVAEQPGRQLDGVEGVLQLWEVGGDALLEVGDLVLRRADQPRRV